MPEDNLNPATDNLDPEATTEVRDWRQDLDVTIKNHPSLQNFKGVPDLAKSWVEAQKLIGKDKIPVPGEKATKADWDMVFERLGRPKLAEDYTLASPDELKLPKDFPLPTDDFLKEFKKTAYDLGLLPNQVAELYKWFMGSEANQYNQFIQDRELARTNAENALRKAWGKAFEQNYQLAEQAVLKYGTEKFIEKLKASGLNNDPDMIQFIASMAKNFSEDKIAGKPVGLTPTPEEALAEINKIKGEAMKDKQHPYNNKFHPEHEALVSKLKTLFELAYPDKG